MLLAAHPVATASLSRSAKRLAVTLRPAGDLQVHLRGRLAIPFHFCGCCSGAVRPHALRALGVSPILASTSPSSFSSSALQSSGPRCSEKADEQELARRYEDFTRMLRDPEDIFIRRGEARKMFNLTRADFEELGDNFILKESPFERGTIKARQYPLKEVVELARRKHSEEALLRHFSNHYLLRHADSEDVWKIYGEKQGDEDGSSDNKVQLGKMYWYNAPSTTTTEGRRSVLQGLKTNMGICMAKGVVWFGTGSHVMFADLMHSIADVMNYSYRLIELNRSSRLRDVYHPYGYAPLRYITADRSFVFLGFVGGICPIISGVSEFMHHRDGLIPMGDHLVAPAAVFLVSALLEGVAVKTAYREILGLYVKELGDAAEAQRYGLREVMQYLREGRDVMSTATFTEASSGVIASLTGLTGIAASWHFQSGSPDVAASLLMATMVCGVSSFLLRKSGNALLGQTLPRWRVKRLIMELEGHPAVVNVYDVKTEMIGTDTVRFKAEVQFNPQTITERILRAMRNDETGFAAAASTSHHAVVTARLRQVVLQLQQGVATEAGADAWLYRNNNLFYEALAWELKDVEKVVRDELREFRNVHIDLEPW